MELILSCSGKKKKMLDLLLKPVIIQILRVQGISRNAD